MKLLNAINRRINKTIQVYGVPDCMLGDYVISRLQDHFPLKTVDVYGDTDGQPTITEFYCYGVKIGEAVPFINSISTVYRWVTVAGIKF